MTITNIGAIGTAGVATDDQVSTVITTTSQALAGTFLVVDIAVDNNATVTGDSNAVSGVVDSAGNTYTLAKGYANSPGGVTRDGADISIWYAVLGATLASGGTITATFTSSADSDASAARVRKFTLDTGSKIAVEGTPGGATGSGSLNVTTANVECLRIRSIAIESNSNTNMTATSGWSVGGVVRSGAGTSSAEITLRSETQITTATGSASAPTSVPAGDAASAYVAFKELVLQTLTPTLFASSAGSFGTQAVAATYGIAATKFANTNTFFTPVSAATYELAATAFTSATTAFGTPVVTAPYDLTATKFANTNTFFTPVVTGGAISLLPTKLTNTNSFGTPVITTTTPPYRPQVRSGMWRRHMGW